MNAPRASAWRIVLILLAVMIALPAFVMGAELSHALGAVRAIQSSLAGGAILALIAALAGAAGAHTRKTTYELITDAFGEYGARLANGVLGLSILGWYGVVAMMFGQALASVSPALARAPIWALALGGCVLTTVTAMIGFRALDLLSAITTPLKMLLLAWTFIAALSGGLSPVWSFVPAIAMPMGMGVSMVAGGLMVGAVLSPDICRFAQSPRHAALACALAYGLGFPLVLTLAGLPSLASGDKDLVRIMLTLGLGVPALLIVALTAWSTNSFNLYATTLIGSTLRPRQPPWQLTLVAGLVGTGLGLAGIGELLVPYLLWLGVCIPPIAGIYLVHVALAPSDAAIASRWRADALIAWAVGSTWAALSPPWNLALTAVPALDSIAVSALIYGVVHRLLRYPGAEISVVAKLGQGTTLSAADRSVEKF
ncbi:cytosine permease [Paucibacter sp. DJ2R-2]|uniref:cytosine permease n=1 Tax=Paucibacter sp. DJ2R-2 TaxID=2893558 RepID=UPI0021E3F3A7|nr:cytosine permease [Paucibacter sp. DJ2R-2]MCV2438600.1 cytosine permease [Paucibacter sp. DJ2R-2]